MWLIESGINIDNVNKPIDYNNISFNTFEYYL